MLANQLERANKRCAGRQRYSVRSEEGLTFEIWHFSTYFRHRTSDSLVGKVWGWESERWVIVQTDLYPRWKTIREKKQTDKKAWNERHSSSEVSLNSVSFIPLFPCFRESQCKQIGNSYISSFPKLSSTETITQLKIKDSLAWFKESIQVCCDCT